MQRSSHSLTYGQQFTVKVRKDADGTFVATSPNVPIGEHRASSEVRAIQMANDALAAYAASPDHPNEANIF